MIIFPAYTYYLYMTKAICPPNIGWTYTLIILYPTFS